MFYKIQLSIQNVLKRFIGIEHIIPNQSQQALSSSLVNWKIEAFVDLIHEQKFSLQMMNEAETDSNQTVVATETSEPITCRVCYGAENKCEILIEPCHCKGTVAKVHRQCLEKWFDSSGSQTCELCLFTFDVESKRWYRLIESFGIWIRKPFRKRMLMHDLLFFGSIALISVMMIGLVIFGLHHFQFDENYSKIFSEFYFVSLCLVAFLWIIIFTVSFLLFVNLQIYPWLHWWQSTKKISLITNWNC